VTIAFPSIAARADRDRLAKLLGMLGSEHADERDNGALAIERPRRELGAISPTVKQAGGHFMINPTRIPDWVSLRRNSIAFVGIIVLAISLGIIWLIAETDHPFEQIDFVSTWKAVSITLTGAFGALGLLTEYKDKNTNQVTNWGRVALGGIVVSTVLGVLAQLVENASDQKKTQQAVADLKRTLTPLTDPTLLLNADAPCDGTFLQFCKEIQDGNAAAWQKWPYPQSPEVFVKLSLFRDKKRADEAAKYALSNSGYTLIFRVPHSIPDAPPTIPTLTAAVDPMRNGQVVFYFSGFVPPMTISNDEEIFSTLDLSQAFMNIFVQPVEVIASPTVPSLLPRYISLQFRTGRAININSDDVTELKTSPVKIYRAVVPSQSY
jgi:hypothetical protein